jgi:hypothetical protein
MSHKEVIEAAGGIYRGKMSEGNQHVVLFDSPQTRSTLCLPVAKVTVETVRGRIVHSNLQFAKANLRKSVERLREATNVC